MMNSVLFSFVFYSLTGLSLIAQDRPIGGSLFFRGTVEGSKLNGPSFSLVVGDDSVSITAKKSKSQFSFPIKGQTVQDALLSANQKCAAILLKNSKGRGYALISTTEKGKPNWFVYKSYDMIKGVDWIVELGAVSDSGSLILAKGAFMLPAAEDGSQSVNHRWMIFSIGENSLKVVEAEGGLEKWGGILEAHVDKSEELLDGNTQGVGGQPATPPRVGD